MPFAPSDFDTLKLRLRAEHWRMMAAQAPSEVIRGVCLSEAEYCERRLRRSFETPVIFVRGERVEAVA